ncbi:hypothetical protein Rhopal_001493-T1 [Rhodotorula paludigena]|uniref:PHD-type domain-containing protein n=1 Tax=Rhodotorula paludigena TaxID=86838 RepID=A0AAV5GGR1_9BASI|nr:hypothetical protein Rhopal_001493-T1 [Rhodotorula paludigena]
MPPRASSVARSLDGAAASARSTPEPLAAADSDSRAASPLPGPTDAAPRAPHADPLARQELEAFGTDAVDEALPHPPRDPNALHAATGGAAAAAAAAAANGTLAPAQAGTTLGGGAKRSLAASGPLARAKRPKNVKFSPTKTGKALGRRGAAPEAVQGDLQLPNNDFCDACGGKGHFLCCEGGCLRSFHFSCLEPPLELDEVPDESWYCKVCRAAANPPPRLRAGFFTDLIYKVDTENPKQFSLTPELKGFFKHVATGTNGEFLDSIEHRPPSKITGRAIGQEDRDGYRLKDKNGKPIICYNCDEAASPVKRRRIISCDFCDQHWHLDCLDPPMTGMPPPTRKWMCPLHSDLIVPRKRQPKQTQTVTIDQPYRPNNGDIIVLPPRDAGAQEEVDEMTVNRVRYQVPEQHIILDFWGRLTGKKLPPPPPPKKAKIKSPRKRAATSGYDSGDSSPLSDLTSSDEDDSDEQQPSTSKAAPAPSALDSLALLAEVRYVDFLAQQQQQTGTNGTPAKDKGKGVASPAPAATRDLPPAQPNSIHRRRGPRPSATPVGAPIPKRPSLGGPGTPAGAGAGAASGSGPRSRGASPSLSPGAGAGAARPSEVVVDSKEDLKALTYVRKLLRGTEGDAANRAALLGFLEGEAILPKLQSAPSSTPWSRPWDNTAKQGGGSAPQASPPLVSPSASPALGTTAPDAFAAPAASTLNAQPATAATTPAPPAASADAPAAAAAIDVDAVAASQSGIVPPSASTAGPTTQNALGSALAPLAQGSPSLPSATAESPLPFALPTSTMAAASSVAPASTNADVADASGVKQEDEGAKAEEADAMAVDNHPV